jgi:hypothetical protein
MRGTTIRLLLATSLIVASNPLPAAAQFGFPGVRMPGVGRMPVPLPVPGRGLGRVGIFPIMPFGRVHRTFGILGAVVIGGVILGRMSRRDGVEVTRRTRAVVDRDRDREVVETYQTKDGGNQVTITAAPVQRVSDIKDDPVLKQTADTAKQASAESEKEAPKNKKSKAKESAGTEAKLESEFLKVDQLPPDTQCRKVTTELELKPKKGNSRQQQAGGENSAANKTSNTSILCQTTGGEWKPASA